MVAEIIIENLVEIINWNLHANFNLTVDLTHYGNFPVKIVKDAIGDEIIMIDSSNSGIVLYGNAVTVVDCCSEKNWKDNLNEVVIVVRSFYTDEEALEFFKSYSM